MNDELFPGLAERIRAMNERITPEQAAITAGDWIAGTLPDVGLRYLAYIQEEVDTGYLYGCWYTQWMPDGEWGDNHRTVVGTKLSPTGAAIAAFLLGITLRPEHLQILAQP